LFLALRDQRVAACPDKSESEVEQQTRVWCCVQKQSVLYHLIW